MKNYTKLVYCEDWQLKNTVKKQNKNVDQTIKVVNNTAFKDRAVSVNAVFKTE